MKRHLNTLGAVGFTLIVCALVCIWWKVQGGLTTPSRVSRTDLQQQAAQYRVMGAYFNAMADQIDPPTPTPTK